MRTIKKIWGIIPISIYLLIKIVLLIIEKSANLVLRDTPAYILYWFLILSILILIIYIIIKFFNWGFIKKYKFTHIVKNITIFLYCVGAFILLCVGVFCSTFTYCSEDVVIENGVKMVARDTSFLDFGMEYYKYENALFRGKQLLKEISNKTYWIYNSNGELVEEGTYDR